MPVGRVSGSSTLQISWEASYLWGLLCPPVYLLFHFHSLWHVQGSTATFISIHSGMSRAVQPHAAHDRFPAELNEDSLELYWAGTVSVVWDWEKPADHPSVAQNLLMIIVHTIIAPKHLGYFLTLLFLQLNACSLSRENRTLIKWLVCLYFKVDWFWWCCFVFVLFIFGVITINMQVMQNCFCELWFMPK